MNNVNTSKDKSRLIYYTYNNSRINYYTTGRFLHIRLPDFPLATLPPLSGVLRAALKKK